VNISFNSLIDKIKDQKVLLLCGPNVSASSKELPAWDAVVRQLVAKLDLPEDFDTRTLAAAAQFYIQPESRNETRNDARKRGLDTEVDKEQEQHRRRYLARHIALLLNDPIVKPSDVHRYIAALPFNTILTTNWDNLLEQAFDQLHKPYVTVVHDPDISYTREGATTLVKLRGSIEQPESLKISVDDLLKLEVEKPELLSFLARSADIKTLLFLGFDFADYEFRQLYDSLLGTSVSSKRQVVAVQSAPVAEEYADYWRHRDVEFVNVTMLSFLQQVGEALGISITSCARPSEVVRTGSGDTGVEYVQSESELGEDAALDPILEIQQLSQRLNRLSKRKKEGASLSLENQIRRVETKIDELRRKSFSTYKS
jgi:hypothetical protein